MNQTALSRRLFIGTAAAAVATLKTQQLFAQRAPAFKTKLLKALIAPAADVATCERIAKAGFSGFEIQQKEASIEKARAGRKCAEQHGLKIHSLMYGWAQFNHATEEARRKSIDDAKRALEITAEFGATAMLLVPCRIDGKMPAPSQFNIAFDPVTLKMTRAAEGPEVFAEYIEKQNIATERSRAAVEELIPIAEKHNVVIGLENVWNNLWVKPDFAAAFVKSFKNKCVRPYLDLGNHVRYAQTEAWLRAVGSDIIRLHIKDFKINREAKNEGGFVPIGKGSIDWISIRKVIEEIGYDGWVSIESGGYSDAEHSAMMDRFFAGTPILG
ncbi:MAG: sugar phosphate isomerase/epimerase family protein [bacterium]